jgi:hypothetical protein
MHAALKINVRGEGNLGRTGLASARSAVRLRRSLAAGRLGSGLVGPDAGASCRACARPAVVRGAARHLLRRELRVWPTSQRAATAPGDVHRRPGAAIPPQCPRPPRRERQRRRASTLEAVRRASSSAAATVSNELFSSARGRGLCNRSPALHVRQVSPAQRTAHVIRARRGDQKARLSFWPRETAGTMRRPVGVVARPLEFLPPCSVAGPHFGTQPAR